MLANLLQTVAAGVQVAGWVDKTINDLITCCVITLFYMPESECVEVLGRSRPCRPHNAGEPRTSGPTRDALNIYYSAEQWPVL